MELSIIIPTYNEKDYLPTLLNCLKNQTYKNFETIVADANSIDTTKQLAKAFGVKVVDGGIPSVGRNNGAKIAQAKILCFMDSDISFANDFLEKSISEFKDRNLDAANVLYEHEGNRQWVSKVVNFFRNKKIIYSSQCLFIKRQDFLNLNGFDSQLSLGEDVDIGSRIAHSKLTVGLLKTFIKVSNRRLDRMGAFNLMVRGGILYLLGKIFPKSLFVRYQNWAMNFYGGWEH